TPTQLCPAWDEHQSASVFSLRERTEAPFVCLGSTNGKRYRSQFVCQVRGQFRKGTPLEGSDLFELKLYVCVLDPVGVPDVEVVVLRFVLGRVGRDLVDIDVHRGDPMGGRGDDLLPGDTGLFFELAQ